MGFIYCERMKLRILLTLLCAGFTVHGAQKSEIPPLVLAVVVDQFSYHELIKLKDYLAGGIGFMYHNGVTYENAYVPHGVPDTAVGHASLNSGALPKDHGIIGNYWYTRQEKLIQADEDTPANGAVFKQDGTLYPFGRSAHNIMVDTLSDQLMLRNSPQKRYAVVSMSFKSTAAVTLAGHLGMPIWFDEQTGRFTTSKAYASAIPTWVQKFNRAQKVDTRKTVAWQLAYPETDAAYRYNNIKNYEFAGSWGFSGKAKGVAGTSVAIDPTTLQQTPAGNELLTDLAIAALDEYADHQKPDHVLMWVSMSGPDKIGHPFGPDSLEKVDLLYHTDQDIKRLFDHATKRYGAGNVLLVVTADHGVMPIPEYVHNAGYTAAQRILIPTLIEQLNQFVQKKFGYKDFVRMIVSNNVYLDRDRFEQLDRKDRRTVLQAVKKYLMKIPGIKRAWTQYELAHADLHMELHELAAFCKNQIEPTRSGQLYIQVSPYTLLTDAEFGASHASPYDYDTHVPLMIYQRGKFQKKRIMDIVWIQQVAPTLAYLLQVPRPSASTYNVLPGLF